MERHLRCFLFAIAALLMALMVASLFLQVLAREFRWPVDWTEETGRFAFISMVFLAAAYATLTDSHLRVSVFSDIIARRIGGRPVAIFHTLVLLSFAGLMVYFSGFNFFDGLRFPNISPALRFNQNILFSVMCVGFSIIFVVHLLDLFRLLRGGALKPGEQPGATQDGHGSRTEPDA